MTAPGRFPHPPRLTRMKPSRLLPLALIAALAPAARGQDPKVDFAHDVLPLLKEKCAKCHTNGTYKGGVSMDTRADLIKSKVVVPGKSRESLLIMRVTSTDPEVRMPPKGPPLSAKEVATLRAWIDGGIEWEAGFSFKPPAYTAPLKPRRPTLPAA